MSCITYCYHRDPLAEALQKVARLGFRAVEVWAGHSDGKASFDGGGDPAAVRRLAQEAHLQMEAYHVGSFSEEDVGRMEAAFDFARALGVGVVNGCASPRVVDDIADLCEQYDLRFGIENHWQESFELPDDLLPVLARLSPRVGVNFDTGHFASAGCDPLEAYHALQSRLVHVHLKDVLEPGSHTNVPFGRGSARIADVVLELRASQYGGYLCLEYESEGDPSAGLLACRHFVEEILGPTSAAQQ